MAERKNWLAPKSKRASVKTGQHLNKNGESSKLAPVENETRDRQNWRGVETK